MPRPLTAKCSPAAHSRKGAAQRNLVRDPAQKSAAQRLVPALRQSGSALRAESLRGIPDTLPLSLQGSGNVRRTAIWAKLIAVTRNPQLPVRCSRQLLRHDDLPPPSFLAERIKFQVRIEPAIHSRLPERSRHPQESIRHKPRERGPRGVQGSAERMGAHAGPRLRPRIRDRHSRQARRNVDGALLHALRVPFGYWEAKDKDDDLDAEIEKKFRKGYPQDNIIFEDSPPSGPDPEQAGGDALRRRRRRERCEKLLISSSAMSAARSPSSARRSSSSRPTCRRCWRRCAR